MCGNVNHLNPFTKARSYHNGWGKSVFNCPETKNCIKSIKFVFKFRETGAKHIQYAVHLFLQEFEIGNQHVPQLIAMPSGSRSECAKQFNAKKAF